MPINVVVPFVLLALVPLGYRVGATVPWLIVPVAFAAFAVLEVVLGRDIEETAGASASLAHRAPIWTYIAAQLATIVWGIQTAGTAGAVASVGLAIVSGAAAGVFGILAAHEMIHSRRRGERALGLAMLAGVTYMHFRISHLHGHHRRVATREDPATARRGENAYCFVLRSAAGQLAEAWCYERRRTRGKSRPIAGNRVYRYLATSLGIYAAIAGLCGWRGVAFELVLSVTAVFVLELFNYVAHYGLERRRSPEGRLEPVGPVHSWNVAHRLDNALLFNGGRHTHHHRAPATPHQQLRAVEHAPHLPVGLAGSILLALIPPLWRYVMDPKVAFWMAGSSVDGQPPLVAARVS
jgi:alkane 1-monooxygenase